MPLCHCELRDDVGSRPRITQGIWLGIPTLGSRIWWNPRTCGVSSSAAVPSTTTSATHADSERSGTLPWSGWSSWRPSRTISSSRPSASTSTQKRALLMSCGVRKNQKTRHPPHLADSLPPPPLSSSFQVTHFHALSLCAHWVVLYKSSTIQAAIVHLDSEWSLG